MEQNALVEWQVEGMTCTGCANTVKIFLESHGLKNVQVNYSTKEVIFAQPDGKLDIQEISQGLKGLGYHLVLDLKKENNSFINIHLTSAHFTPAALPGH